MYHKKDFFSLWCPTLHKRLMSNNALTPTIGFQKHNTRLLYLIQTTNLDTFHHIIHLLYRGHLTADSTHNDTYTLLWIRLHFLTFSVNSCFQLVISRCGSLYCDSGFDLCFNCLTLIWLSSALGFVSYLNYNFESALWTSCLLYLFSKPECR